MTVPADELVRDVATLVSCESPSADLDGVRRCADVLDTIARRRTGRTAERIEVDGRPHLRWGAGPARVVLLGHFDTVWPRGTLERWPFSVDGDRMTGPGVCDMKAGLVQAFAALATLDDCPGVTMLATSDEEIGSPTSRSLIESTCRDARAVLVLEASEAGALKIARKGVATFHLDIVGRAAHAGLEPERGVNATVEAAYQVLAGAALADVAAGTTVTPTLLAGGTTANTVPAAARVTFDVRAATQQEMQRVHASLLAVRPRSPEATVTVSVDGLRAPLEERMSADLFARAQRHASSLGLGELTGAAVGGGSDGNITAGLGIPTLDGLGAVGGNPHAEGEWASAAALASRSALVAALVRELLEETQ